VPKPPRYYDIQIYMMPSKCIKTILWMLYDSCSHQWDEMECNELKLDT